MPSPLSILVDAMLCSMAFPPDVSDWGLRILFFFRFVLLYELMAKMYMHGCRDYKSSDRPPTMGHKLDIESV